MGFRGVQGEEPQDIPHMRPGVAEVIQEPDAPILEEIFFRPNAVRVSQGRHGPRALRMRLRKMWGSILSDDIWGEENSFPGKIE